LNWKVVFIGSSDNDQYDQLLEDIYVPVDSADHCTFELSVQPPDLSKLPSIEDIFDVTAVSIIVLYNEREFFRCSYLLTHEYPNNQQPQSFTTNGLYRYT
jgi:histone chaperone ASF1